MPGLKPNGNPDPSNDGTFYCDEIMFMMFKMVRASLVIQHKNDRIYKAIILHLIPKGIKKQKKRWMLLMRILIQ